MDKRKEKKKKNYPVIIILGIFMILILIIGITYAVSPDSLFRSMLGEKIQIDESAYGENQFDSSEIEMIPILDKDVQKRENNVIHISFLVGGAKSNTIDNIIYDIALNELEIDCSLLSPYLKWKLLKNNKKLSEGSLDYKFDTIQEGRFLLTNIQQDLVKYSDDKENYDQYDFYMWLSDSCQNNDLSECQDSPVQDELLGKKIKGKIEIELYADTKVENTRKPSASLDKSTCSNN